MREVRVTGVRGDQIRRLNITVWRGRGEELVEKTNSNCAKHEKEKKKQSQRASFAVPYVNVPPQSPACADHPIYYLHDLRCLKSASWKCYKNVDSSVLHTFTWINRVCGCGGGVTD